MREPAANARAPAGPHGAPRTAAIQARPFAGRFAHRILAATSAPLYVASACFRTAWQARKEPT